MPAGQRDVEAVTFAEQLTAAAAEMRRKSTHQTVQTVKEVDATEVARLRRDTSDAMLALADEVVALKEAMADLATLKALLLEVRDITADELQRRRA